MVGDDLLGFTSDFCGVFEVDDGLEAGAVFGAWAVELKGFFVEGGAVADVLVEVVGGVFFCEVFHVVVTGDFGENAGGGDFGDEEVGFDEGGNVTSEGCAA